MPDQPVDFGYFCKRNALTRGERTAYTFSNGDEDIASISFAELDRAARAVASVLQARRLIHQPVLLLLDSALDFVRAFNGCLYAGAVAVPVNLPTRSQRLDKIRLIANDSGARFAITSAQVAKELAGQGCDFACLDLAILLAEPALAASGFLDVALAPDAPAFLQYTSGSTGAPKGVMVTHANLIANQAMIREGFAHHDGTVFASWLPLYHDMGLVGTMLHPTYLGIPCTLMPPMAFVQQPARWLKLISRSRATTSGGPNFAYELCVRRVDPADLEGVDLSSWQVAFNGAEPIQAGTLQRFYEKFARFGFSKQAFYPCYGMAEATLLIAGGVASQPPRICSVSAAGLERGDVRDGPTREDEGSRELVSCGRGFCGEQIAIVEPESAHERESDQIGEVWIAGPNVALGYWKNPEASDHTFRAYTRSGKGPFLRTGDLGFVRNGELFITGRLKDLIIVSGKNHYPQDLELTVQRAHPLFAGRPGAAVASSANGIDEVDVVQELDLRAASAAREVDLVRCLRDAVMAEHGVVLKRVLLIAPGKLPMTTSGKVQRSLCRALLQSGKFVPALGTREPLDGVA